MNSKKNLLRARLVLLLMAAVYFSSAQDFKHFPKAGSTPGHFDISLQSLSSLNPQQLWPVPYYTFYIETGNGRYKRITDKLYDDYINTPYSFNYYPVIQSGSISILNIVGHYDTIKPPRGIMFTYLPTINPAGDALQPQVNLAPGKRIGIDYSDSSVVIGDTMTMVVTYKPSTSFKTVVAFFYNEKDFAIDGKIFSGITTKDQTYPFVFSDGSSFRYQDTRAIRVNETSISIDVNLPSSTQVPGDAFDLLKKNSRDFYNGVYFIIPSMPTGDERNAFISMVAPFNTGMLSTVANIKALIIHYDSTSGKVMYTEPATDDLPVGRFASDPNGIVATPPCLDKLGGEPFNKPIKYEITFRNDGPGPAESVTATVYLPEGIQLPESGLFNDRPRSFNIESTIGGQKVTFVNSLSLTVKYTYRVDVQKRTIVFTMKHIKLPGIDKPQAKKNILLRLGTISFTLNTMMKPANNQEVAAARDKLKCLYTDVGIQFTSLRNGTEETNGFFVWGSDLVRSNCKYSYTSANTDPVFPPCPRKQSSALPHTQ